MSLGAALSILDRLLGLIDRALHKRPKPPKYAPIKPVPPRPVKTAMDPHERKGPM